MRVQYLHAETFAVPLEHRVRSHGRIERADLEKVLVSVALEVQEPVGFFVGGTFGRDVVVLRPCFYLVPEP